MKVVQVGSDSEERLALARWLITRNDTMRVSLISRSAVVLSANALIAAGMTVVVFQLEPSGILGGRLTFAAITALATVTLLLTGLSVVRAAESLINVRPWRRTFPTEPRRGMFFNAHDTVTAAPSQAEFRDMFLHADQEAMLDFAMVELWAGTRGLYRRYQFTRKAVRSLRLGIGAFLAAVILSLITTLLHAL